MTENASTSKTAVTQKRLSEFGKRMSKFFKDIRNELKKVIWPTRDQLINNTLTVLMVCLLVGIVIWVSDEILTKIVEWTLTR